MYFYQCQTLQFFPLRVLVKVKKQRVRKVNKKNIKKNRKCNKLLINVIECVISDPLYLKKKRESRTKEKQK